MQTKGQLSTMTVQYRTHLAHSGWLSAMTERPRSTGGLQSHELRTLLWMCILNVNLDIYTQSLVLDIYTWRLCFVVRTSENSQIFHSPPSLRAQGVPTFLGRVPHSFVTLNRLFVFLAL